MELYKRDLEIAEKVSDGLELPSEFVIDQNERIVLAHSVIYNDQKRFIKRKRKKVEATDARSKKLMPFDH